jgi:hypothetical protein
VTARAITYYLDVSNECTRRIVQVDGAVRAICNRLATVEVHDRTSKDLGTVCAHVISKTLNVCAAEQCVKVLELMCQREATAIFEAGGLACVLTFVQTHSTSIHKVCKYRFDTQNIIVNQLSRTHYTQPCPLSHVCAVKWSQTMNNYLSVQKRYQIF